MIVSGVDIAVKKSKRKTLSIFIERDGSVSALVPSHLDDEEIVSILKTKEYQIHRNLAQWLQLNERHVTREYVNGQSFLYLGRNYRLKLVDDKLGELKFSKGYFLLSKNELSSAEQYFIDFYRNKLKEKIKPLIKRYKEQLGVSPNDVKVMELKKATEVKHKIAERMKFNGVMYTGGLNNEQYGEYLKSQLAIFTVLEKNFKFPHIGLYRVNPVQKDLISVGVNQLELIPDKATTEYVNYLSGVTQEVAEAHIYLNYLAIMFGGQMMKSKTPGAGNMYEFDNMMECAGSVRAIQKDEWADEVNKGFDFMINIFKELENVL